jgi:hypothetical protein
MVDTSHFGRVNKLQTDGSSLRFWTDHMPAGVGSLRIPDSSLFAAVLLAAINKDWPVAVGYKTNGDSIGDVIILQAPPE